MLKDADHLNNVKRLRVAEKDLQPYLPHYEVRKVIAILLQIAF